MKYNEDLYTKEMYDYMSSTYKKHYCGEDGVQALDLVLSLGHGEGFCVGSCIKYLSRYGKKNGKNRDDILKFLHYGYFLLYNHDKIHGEVK